jgi:hypothetical protein
VHSSMWGTLFKWDLYVGGRREGGGGRRREVEGGGGREEDGAGPQQGNLYKI